MSSLTVPGDGVWVMVCGCVWERWIDMRVCETVPVRSEDCCHFLTMSSSCEERYQAPPILLISTASNVKLGGSK